jgi:hypothetical protein
MGLIRMVDFIFDARMTGPPSGISYLTHDDILINFNGRRAHDDHKQGWKNKKYQGDDQFDR